MVSIRDTYLYKFLFHCDICISSSVILCREHQFGITNSVPDRQTPCIYFSGIASLKSTSLPSIHATTSQGDSYRCSTPQGLIRCVTSPRAPSVFDYSFGTYDISSAMSIFMSSDVILGRCIRKRGSVCHGVLCTLLSEVKSESIGTNSV
jgi:hypothetical protein